MLRRGLCRNNNSSIIKSSSFQHRFFMWRYCINFWANNVRNSYTSIGKLLVYERLIVADVIEYRYLWAEDMSVCLIVPIWVREPRFFQLEILYKLCNWNYKIGRFCDGENISICSDIKAVLCRWYTTLRSLLLNKCIFEIILNKISLWAKMLYSCVRRVPVHIVVLWL